MIFEKFFGQLKQLPVDLRNRRNFKAEMKAELDDPNSKMNQFGLTLDDEFKHISAMVTVPDEFQRSGTEGDIMAKLRETAKPMTNYLCFELGWAEMLSVPSFFYLDDPSDPGASRTYLAMWDYMPLVDRDASFYLKCSALAAGCAGLTAALTAAVMVLV